MKHKLLSLFALAGAMFMSASVWAQDEPTPSKWPDPVKPSSTYSGTFVAPEAGKIYYIYNVGAAQFLGAGRSYGTRAVVTSTNVVTTEQPAVTLATNVDYILPWALSSENGGFVIKHLGTTRATKDTGKKENTLVHEGNSAWVDAPDTNSDRQSHRFWKIDPVEGEENQYLITPDDATTGISYGVDGSNLVNSQVAETWTDLTITVDIDPESGEPVSPMIPWVNWKFVDEADSVSVQDWSKAYNNAIAVYEAKFKLRDAMDEGDKAGVDLTAAEAIYYSSDATLEAVNAAHDAILASIKRAEYMASGLFDNASEDFPSDITDLVLVNPDFETDYVQWNSNIPGWTITIGAQNKCTQEEAQGLTHFIEAWDGSNVRDGEISQTVYGLPFGVYRLEGKAFVNTTGECGVNFFISDGQTTKRTPVTSNPAQPYSVKFVNSGSDVMTFGLEARSATTNWLGADDFKLYFLGAPEGSVWYLQLQSDAKDCKDALADLIAKDTRFSTDAEETLNNIIAEIVDIDINISEEACATESKKLADAYNSVLESVTAYEQLLIYTTYNETGSKLRALEATVADNGWTDLAQALSDLQLDFDDAYYGGSWTTEQVKNNINSLTPSIRTWVQEHPEALKKGNDLTVLLINADFEEGTYFAGWDAADDEVQPDKDYGSIPGWTISSGNITQMKHVIETYHRKFDFNQTIKNMPAGVYDITVQGFVRHDDTDVNDGKSTIFYAGNLETQLMLRSDQWSDTPLYDPDTMGDPCGGNAGDQTIKNSWGEDVLVPNGMSGFYFWEKVENFNYPAMDYLKWQEGDLYYTNHIKATLNEPGDFTIGMKSLDSHDWIIWDNFQITYLGNAGEIYALMAEEDFGTLKKVYENTDYLTMKAKSDYADIAKINYSAIATLEAYNEYKEKVDALIDYIQEGTRLGKALHELLSEYETRSVSFDTSDFFLGSFSKYFSDLENGTSLDNDYLRNGPDVLATEWTQCAVKQADTTVFNNLEGIIVNPQYISEDGLSYSLDGWTMEKAEGTTIENYLANEGVAEVYNPSGEYKLYQTIKGLKEGYYHVTVDAFFRPAGMKQEDGREACVSIPSRAFLFAEGDEIFVTPLKNILVGHDSAESIDGGSETTWNWPDETVEYTPNNVKTAAHYFNNVFNAEAEKTNLDGENVYQSVYRNVVNAHVGKEGILTIGITNYGVTDFVAKDWACFSNWTLSLLGAAPDAIKGVSTKGATAPTAIFTIDGRQASRLQRGMNIVRQADGSVKKVLVK